MSYIYTLRDLQIGTTAERVALSPFREGRFFWDTDTESWWRDTGGSWVQHAGGTGGGASTIGELEIFTLGEFNARLGGATVADFTSGNSLDRPTFGQAGRYFWDIQAKALYRDNGVDGWDVVGGGGGGVPSNDDPLALGSASSGVSTDVSRADHVHPMPSPSDVGVHDGYSYGIGRWGHIPGYGQPGDGVNYIVPLTGQYCTNTADPQTTTSVRLSTIAISGGPSFEHLFPTFRVGDTLVFMAPENTIAPGGLGHVFTVESIPTVGPGDIFVEFDVIYRSGWTTSYGDGLGDASLTLVRSASVDGATTIDGLDPFSLAEFNAQLNDGASVASFTSGSLPLPPAGPANSYWYDQDNSILYRSNGSGWFSTGSGANTIGELSDFSLASLNAKVTDATVADFTSGTTLGRPAAEFDNRYYWDTELNVLYRDNSSSWEIVGGGGSGTIGGLADFALADINAKITDATLASFTSGTTLGRPAAEFNNRYYWDTELTALYRDNSSSWELVAGSPGATGIGDLTDFDLSELNAKVTDATLADFTAGPLPLPAAGTAGRYRFETDNNILYRDSGASWVPIGALTLSELALFTLGEFNTQLAGSTVADFTSGDTLSRPSFGQSGRYYWDTELKVLYRDNGVDDWEIVGGSPGATGIGDLTDFDLSELNAKVTDATLADITSGAGGARPAAGTLGRYFWDTDTHILYRDNITSWDAAAASVSFSGLGLFTLGQFNSQLAGANMADFGSGDTLSRPSFGQAGRYYWDTELKILYRDNGVDGWEIVGGGGSLPDIAQNELLGRSAAGTGPASAQDASTVTAMLDLFAPSAKGLVPAAGGSPSATNFLNEAGNWVEVISGSNPRVDALVADSGTKAELEAAITGNPVLLTDAQLGANDGIATLGPTGKVPIAQMPVGSMTFLGNWNATSNSPDLTEATYGGNNGDTYSVSVAGSIDLGSGLKDFAVNDRLVWGGSSWTHEENTDEVGAVGDSHVSSDGSSHSKVTDNESAITTLQGTAPDSDQKAALAGTNGAPNDSNRYVVNDDLRLTDSRSPTAHTHTPAEVNLGNVDNVQQIPLSEKGLPDGVATLDGAGKLPVEQLPDEIARDPNNLATTTVAIPADTTISIGTNVAGELLAYEDAADFQTLEITVNGIRRTVGPDNTFDCYPAGVAANGDFACTFDIPHGTPPSVILVDKGGGGAGGGTGPVTSLRSGIVSFSGTCSLGSALYRVPQLLDPLAGLWSANAGDSASPPVEPSISTIFSFTAPYDGVVTSYTVTTHKSSSSAEYTMELYKVVYVDGSSANTYTKIGDMGSMTISDSFSDKRIFTGTFTTGNALNAGECLQVMCKVTTTASATAYHRIGVVFEET